MAGDDRRWRVAVDFGGTLTDVVLRPPHGDGRGDVLLAFASDGPAAPARLDAAIGRALDQSGLGARDVASVAVT
ncbi:MAG: hypothetical protein ACKOCT_21345, partial [Alphaproteobacteria bacterium]